MKDGAFPDLPAWSRQFRAIVGEAYLIRGVEVAVDGVLVTDRDHLALRVPGLAMPLRLVPRDGRRGGIRDGTASGN